MHVRMFYYISGRRHDGRDWPDPGSSDGIIEVPDWEGEDLIRGGHAVRADPAGPGGIRSLPPDVAAHAEAAHEEADQAAAHAEVASQQAAAAAEAVEPGIPDAGPGQAGALAGGASEEPASTAAEPDVAAAGQPVAAPGPSASKQAWIDYAVAGHGADVHAASGMTKADLMSRYGGRL